MIHVLVDSSSTAWLAIELNVLKEHASGDRESWYTPDDTHPAYERLCDRFKARLNEKYGESCTVRWMYTPAAWSLIRKVEPRL